MPVTIFENAQVIDTNAGTVLPDYNALVEDDRILEISPPHPNSLDVGRIDVKGRTLL